MTNKVARALSILELMGKFPSEEEAVARMERACWGSKPKCPCCDTTGGITPAKSRGYQWWCKGCRKQFKIKTNSFMHGSNIKVRIWCIALYIIVTAHKEDLKTDIIFLSVQRTI